MLAQGTRFSPDPEAELSSGPWPGKPDKKQNKNCANSISQQPQFFNSPGVPGRHVGTQPMTTKGLALFFQARYKGDLSSNWAARGKVVRISACPDELESALRLLFLDPL